MRKYSAHSGSSLKIAFIFIALTATLLLAGLCLKLFLVLQASSFDGSHQYILEVDQDTRNSMLISFNPDKKTIEAVTASGNNQPTLGNVLGVPIDVRVHVPVSQNINELVGNLFWQKNGLTSIDKLRLLLFVNTLSPNAIHMHTVLLPVDSTTRQNLLTTVFVDSSLYSENVSIAIVNATGVGGVGSAFAGMLTTIGASVVSVTTATTVQDATTLTAIHTNEYTVSRIGKILHVSAHTNSHTSIADVTITLGRNSLSLVQ